MKPYDMERDIRSTNHLAGWLLGILLLLLLLTS
jgi:hypothetical protein